MLSERRKICISACQKFMCVTLMTYIKNNCIFRTIKNSVKSNCKLNNSQITGKMSAIFCDGFYYNLTDFFRKKAEFRSRNLF